MYDPLPEGTGAHPEECDWIGYVRFRSANGPARSVDADAIMVIIPGFLGGAGTFDQVARNTVRAAAERGRPVEFWALDRRANCLEDHHGVHAGGACRQRVGRLRLLLERQGGRGQDLRGLQDGSRRGLPRASSALKRTVRDWNTILVRGIPQPAHARAQGHLRGPLPLGGPLTAAYASWDFDGKEDTQDDAGYNQCAGLVGLDTTLSVNGEDSGVAGGGAALGLVGASGGAPFVEMTLPRCRRRRSKSPRSSASAAFHQPDGTNMLRDLPHSPKPRPPRRRSSSRRDAANFATGMPSIRDFTISNEASLAGVLRRQLNSPPPARQRGLPRPAGRTPTRTSRRPSGGFLAIPEEPFILLYSWLELLGGGGRTARQLS